MGDIEGLGFMVSQNEGYLLGGPHNKDYSIVFGGLYRGPLMLGIRNANVGAFCRL